MELLARWNHALVSLDPKKEPRLARLIGLSYAVEGGHEIAESWPPVTDGCGDWHRSPAGGYLRRDRPQSFARVSRFVVFVAGKRSSAQDLVALKELILEGELRIVSLRTEAHGAHPWEIAEQAAWRVYEAVRPAPLRSLEMARAIADKEWDYAREEYQVCVMRALGAGGLALYRAAWHAVHLAKSIDEAVALTMGQLPPSHPSSLRPKPLRSKWTHPEWC